MGSVNIHPGYITYKSYDDPNKNIVVDNEDVLKLLDNIIDEIEEGFTLRNYFELFIHYPNLTMLDAYFPDFIGEFISCPTSGCIGDGKIDKLELLKIFEIEENNGKKTLENHIQFHGFCLEEEQGYAIEYSPLNEILDIPISLGKGYFSPEGKTVTGEWVETSYTLYEFIKSIIWELSFLGTPSQRANSLIELRELTKEIDEAIANEDYSKFKSIDELFDKLNDNEKG